jgi:S-adenosylmethionine-diacylgycerolhomoserine-N-methlytransferase
MKYHPQLLLLFFSFFLLLFLQPEGTLWDDANVLFHNWLHPIKGDSHQQRLESFYAGQSKSYDAFRHRFLHGRLPMIECMPTPSKASKGVWVDLGGGTASNLEHFKDTTAKDGAGLLKNLFSRVYVLDLCRPLLEVAKQRVKVNGWESFVSCVEGDATNLTPLMANGSLPQPGTVDVVTMSYSLTMIPDWQKALQQARLLLKPETGYIAISDFTVTPEHSWLTRFMWPRIFKTDGVNLNPRHIEVLSEMFEPMHLELSKGGFPYVPLLKAPFYVFVGRKTGNIVSPSTGTRAVLEDEREAIGFSTSISLASAKKPAAEKAGEKEAPKSTRKAR